VDGGEGLIKMFTKNVTSCSCGDAAFSCGSFVGSSGESRRFPKKRFWEYVKLAFVEFKG